MSTAVTQIEVQELPARIEEIAALASARNEIIVMNGRVPCAKLVAVPEEGTRIPDLHPGSITTTDDFDDPLPDAFWLGTP
jgi:antitoxin (DNA-binding transcriptional repressor) of toxin-antitoxin stability system